MTEDHEARERRIRDAARLRELIDADMDEADRRTSVNGAFAWGFGAIVVSIVLFVIMLAAFLL